MGYFAELDGDESITMDTEELSKAQWFAREEMPAHNDGISLTREMMGVFENKVKYEEFMRSATPLIFLTICRVKNCIDNICICGKF